MKEKFISVTMAVLIVTCVFTMYEWRQASDREDSARAELQSLQRYDAEHSLQQAFSNALHSLGEEYSEKLRKNPIPVVCINPPKQSRMYPFQ